jgi:hypothetical protein
MLRQKLRVFGALAQRRNVNRDGGDSVKEVVAQQTVTNSVRR